MPTLYIVNHSASLATCLKVAGGSDSILLIEDGVDAAANDQPRPVFALQEDLQLHSLEKLGKNIETTNYAGFVDLVTRHQPIVSWR